MACVAEPTPSAAIALAIARAAASFTPEAALRVLVSSVITALGFVLRLAAKVHRCERLVAGKLPWHLHSLQSPPPNAIAARHTTSVRAPLPRHPAQKAATHKLATRRVRRRGARSREARRPYAKTGARPHYAIPPSPQVRDAAHDAVIIHLHRHGAATGGVAVRLAPPAP